MIVVTRVINILVTKMTIENQLPWAQFCQMLKNTISLHSMKLYGGGISSLCVTLDGFELEVV